MVGYLVNMDFAKLDLHVLAERQRCVHYSILDLNAYSHLLFKCCGDFTGNVHMSQGEKLPHVLDWGCLTSCGTCIVVCAV